MIYVIVTFISLSNVEIDVSGFVSASDTSSFTLTLHNISHHMMCMVVYE